VLEHWKYKLLGKVTLLVPLPSLLAPSFYRVYLITSRGLGETYPTASSSVM